MKIVWKQAFHKPCFVLDFKSFKEEQKGFFYNYLNGFTTENISKIASNSF